MAREFTARASGVLKTKRNLAKPPRGLRFKTKLSTYSTTHLHGADQRTPAGYVLTMFDTVIADRSFSACVMVRTSIPYRTISIDVRTHSNQRGIVQEMAKDLLGVYLKALGNA